MYIILSCLGLEPIISVEIEIIKEFELQKIRLPRASQACLIRFKSGKQASHFTCPFPLSDLLSSVWVVLVLRTNNKSIFLYKWKYLFLIFRGNLISFSLLNFDLSSLLNCDQHLGPEKKQLSGLSLVFFVGSLTIFCYIKRVICSRFPLLLRYRVSLNTNWKSNWFSGVYKSLR